MTALGFLFTDRPGGAARAGEDDYPRIEQLLGSDIRLDVVHVADTGAGGPGAGPGAGSGAGPGEGGAGADDAVRRLGPPERLAAAGEQLRLAGAEAVVWASAGESSGHGWEGAHAQTAALARTTGMPASSTSLAFVHAVRELGARRVAVATARPEPAAARFADFLRAGGAEATVVHTASPAGPAAEGEAGLLALARAADRPDAQAVLLPDTGLATVSHLPALERALGKPVLTASQVTVWEALRLTDRRINAPLLGALFTREPIVQVPPSREQGRE
ncbi:decarboxylase [Streptomyces sp. NPDC047000]|uniref:aspartate racemase/maleate isomerase family protein n=1 Tax=Streptomyces sp. NPDC047000 TaxID=3155474 RepID=UPI00340DA3CE